jgi:hypothetical protein
VHTITSIITSIITTVGLGAALVVAGTTTPVAAADPADRLVGRSFEMRDAAPPHARSGDAARLVSATATFNASNRVTGMPTSTAPQHQFVMPGGNLSVTVEYGYHWQTGALSYHYDLETAMGAPDPESRTRVMLGFGVQSGTACSLEEATSDWLYRYIPDVLLYDNKETPDLASAAGWNCAVLAVDGGPGTPLFDAFVAPLDVVTATPRLTLKAPKKDRLVTGVWTRIPVTVTNSAAEGIDARDVVVAGAGKGVKVRRLEIGSVDGKDDADGNVWAKLVKPKARLRLTVSEMGETLGRATVKLKRRPVPAPPKAGGWSSAGVDFTVRGGKVRGFRIDTQTNCGGYPDVLTTTNNTYDFPTVRIPRNNEVVGSDGVRTGDAAYSVYLDIEFVSPTKAKGSFSYYGPGRCTAIDRFTATRKR